MNNQVKTAEQWGWRMRATCWIRMREEGGTCTSWDTDKQWGREGLLLLLCNCSCLFLLRLLPYLWHAGSHADYSGCCFRQFKGKRRLKRLGWKLCMVAFTESDSTSVIAPAFLMSGCCAHFKGAVHHRIPAWFHDSALSTLQYKGRSRRHILSLMGFFMNRSKLLF